MKRRGSQEALHRHLRDMEAQLLAYLACSPDMQEMRQTLEARLFAHSHADPCSTLRVYQTRLKQFLEKHCGPGPEPFVYRAKAMYVVLSPRAVWSDVGEFRRLVAEAGRRQDVGARRGYLRTAVKLIEPKELLADRSWSWINYLKAGLVKEHAAAVEALTMIVGEEQVGPELTPPQRERVVMDVPAGVAALESLRKLIASHYGIPEDEVILRPGE